MQETIYNYNKYVLSPYDPTKLAILSILRLEDDLISKCGPKVKKTVSFNDIVHFIDEENMMTSVDFECGIKFFRETPTKIRQINRERNYKSRSRENFQYVPGSINIPVLLMNSIARIPFWARTYYGTWFQQLLCYSTTQIIHTLCSISILNQQLNNLEQTLIRCSPHCERWTVKRRDCASNLHSFKQSTEGTDERMKQLLRLRSWVISGSPEQCMKFHRLWWILYLIKGSNFFSCSITAVCWCNICCFSIFFLFLFFDDFEWEVRVLWQLLCMVTLFQAAEAATYLSTLQVHSEVHPSIIHMCTQTSATNLFKLLQDMIRSVLCPIIKHDIMINESLKTD